MKTLLVLRHAKSNWENTDVSDFDRSLNTRGIETAPKVGLNLKKKKLQIDLILSSPAKRAKQTAILVKETAEINAQIKYEEKIYEASSLRLSQIIAKIDDKHETVLLVGHNPGIEDLVRLLSGEIKAFPTAALAKITLKIKKWSDISKNCGELDFLMTPKNI